MIYFTVYSYDRGCCGRKYNNLIEAIKDDSYQVWNDEKIKRAFNFHNGTLAHFKNHAKMNHEQIVSETDFYKLLEQLPSEDIIRHKNFINECLNIFR